MLYTYKQMLMKNRELTSKLNEVAELEPLYFTCCGSWYSDKFRNLMFAYIKRIDTGYRLLVTDGLYKQQQDIESVEDFFKESVKTDMQLLFGKEDFISRITEGTNFSYERS